MPDMKRITYVLLNDLEDHRKEIAENKDPQEAIFEFADKHHEMVLDEPRMNKSQISFAL